LRLIVNLHGLLGGNCQRSWLLCHWSKCLWIRKLSIRRWDRFVVFIGINGTVDILWQCIESSRVVLWNRRIQRLNFFGWWLFWLINFIAWLLWSLMAATLPALLSLLFLLLNRWLLHVRFSLSLQAASWIRE
jgi:hypothetical protein